MTTVNSSEITAPVRREDVLCRDDGQEMLIFDPRNGAIHSLNLTASYIWDLCDGTRTVEQLAKMLAQEFQVQMEQGYRDTRTLIGRLEALGLVRHEAPPSHLDD